MNQFQDTQMKEIGHYANQVKHLNIVQWTDDTCKQLQLSNDILLCVLFCLSVLLVSLKLPMERSDCYLKIK